MPTDGQPPIPEIIIVVGGGDAPGPRLDGLTSLAPSGADGHGDGATVIAADSGLDVARSVGLPVDHLVGDLDSASAPARRAAEEHGVRVHVHERDKDATDLELALDLALDLLSPTAGPPGPQDPRNGVPGSRGVGAGYAISHDPGPIGRLTVVGPGAGRLDHLLADVSLLAAPRLAHVEVRARFGVADLAVVPPGGRRAVGGEPGDQVSLLPVHGLAVGVTTWGLRWPLVDADLGPGTTRGVSNEVVDVGAAVSTRRGTVVVVRPGTRAPDVPARTTAYDPSPRAPDSQEERP